jgi:hypothetical protein
MGRLMKPKFVPGPPMTIGNMRELGVHHLIACAPDRDQHRAAAPVIATR